MCMKKIIYLLLFIGFTSCSSNKARNDAASTADSIRVSDSTAALAAEAAAVEAAGGSNASNASSKGNVSNNWDYSSDEDEMSGKKSYYASCTSKNMVEFSFPYDGGSDLTIIIRKHSKYGHDICFKISKGQFNSDIDGESLLARFDKGSIKRFSCSTSADGSADVLFIDNYRLFLKNLRKSKTCKIQCAFYQGGDQTFSFDTGGLKWNH